VTTSPVARSTPCSSSRRTWTWGGVDDAEQELRQRFGSGTTALDIGDFELELVEDGEIWIDGDSHDVVMRAIGRLNREDQYVIVRGNEILDKPQSDATVRDVGSDDGHRRVFPRGPHRAHRGRRLRESRHHHR